jgi:hypothetical protein
MLAKNENNQPSNNNKNPVTDTSTQRNMNPEESKEEKKQLLVHFLFITDCFKKSTFPKKKKWTHSMKN